MKIPEKYRDIAKYAYSVLRQYPKSEKYTIASDARQALWDMGINLKKAGVTSNRAVKKRFIGQADEQRATLNFLVETGVELQKVKTGVAG